MNNRRAVNAGDSIEPGAMYGAGKILVHEENLVITEDRAELLSRRAPREMPVLEF